MVIELTFDSRFNLPGIVIDIGPDAPLFLVLPLPAGEALFPSPLPPFSVHSYQSLAHRKYHCLCGRFCCSGFFSCSFCRCRFLSAAAFSAAAFLSAAAFSEPLFLLLFCRLQLSLLPLSYSCSLFSSRFLLSFCFGFFSSSVAAFFLASAAAAAASAASVSSSVPQRLPRLFSALRLRLGGFCFCFFLCVCSRFLRCFFAALASASAFALASAAAFAAALQLASALTWPVLRLLQPAFLLLSR